MKSYRGNGYRVLYDVVRDGNHYPEGPRERLRAADDAVRHFRGLQGLGMVPRERECFCVLLLDTRHRTIGFHIASIGTLNTAPVHPVNIFRPALAVSAESMILAHHHPSGDCTPSSEDRRITERLSAAGELLGIQVLDHVVIGGERFYSFSDDRIHPIEGGAS